MGIFEQMSFVRLKLVPIFWGNAAVCLSIIYIRYRTSEGTVRFGSIGAKVAKYYVSITHQILDSDLISLILRGLASMFSMPLFIYIVYFV